MAFLITNWLISINILISQLVLCFKFLFQIWFEISVPRRQRSFVIDLLEIRWTTVSTCLEWLFLSERPGKFTIAFFSVVIPLRTVKLQPHMRSFLPSRLIKGKYFLLHVIYLNFIIQYCQFFILIIKIYWINKITDNKWFF